jgi:hypothetical protein
VSVRIADIDRGFRPLLKRIREFKGGATVSVGVNDEPHAGSDLSNAELGAIHEFGLGTVPERSFLRGWVDEQQGSIRGKLRGLATGIIFRFFTRESVLDNFGQWAVGEVRQRIRDHIPPPLEDETVRRKGGEDTPLLDTEQLINAIEYEVSR